MVINERMIINNQIQETLKPYDKKFLDLITILPRRILLSEDSIKMEYYFDGEWCTEDIIAKKIYGPLLNLMKEINNYEI